MAKPALVDSSILIGLLRRGKDPAVALTRWAGNRDLATCGMVRVEVLRGVRQPKEFRHVETLLDVMLNVPSDNRLWEEAAILAWEMDRKGIVLPAQDLVIAACARRIDAEILTDDLHFGKIPRVKIAGGLKDL